jgi:hypothetical protein
LDDRVVVVAAEETAVEPVPPSLAERGTTGSDGSPPQWKALPSALRMGESEVGPSRRARAGSGRAD